MYTPLALSTGTLRAAWWPVHQKDRSIDLQKKLLQRKGRNTQEEQCAILINGNYGLDLPALLTFAHLAFIAFDLAFLNTGEVYPLAFSLVTFAGAALDGASPLFAAHLAF